MCWTGFELFFFLVFVVLFSFLQLLDEQIPALWVLEWFFFGFPPRKKNQNKLIPQEFKQTKLSICKGLLNKSKISGNGGRHASFYPRTPFLCLQETLHDLACIWCLGVSSGLLCIQLSLPSLKEVGWAGLVFWCRSPWKLWEYITKALSACVR